MPLRQQPYEKSYCYYTYFADEETDVVKKLAKGHTVSKRWSRDLNPEVEENFPWALNRKKAHMAPRKPTLLPGVELRG